MTGIIDGYATAGTEEDKCLFLKAALLHITRQAQQVAGWCEQLREAAERTKR